MSFRHHAPGSFNNQWRLASGMEVLAYDAHPLWNFLPFGIPAGTTDFQAFILAISRVVRVAFFSQGPVISKIERINNSWWPCCQQAIGWDRPHMSQEHCHSAGVHCNLARATTGVSSHNGDWLLALPISAYGWRFDDKAIRIAVDFLGV